MGNNLDDGQVACIWGKHPEMGTWAAPRYPAGFTDSIAGKLNVIIQYSGGPYANTEIMAAQVWGCPPTGSASTIPYGTPTFPGGYAQPPIVVTGPAYTPPAGDGGGDGGGGLNLGGLGAWFQQNWVLALAGGFGFYFVFLRKRRHRREGLF